MTAIGAGVLLGASFAVGAALGIGVLYVVAYNVVRLLAWMQLKRAQREFRERTESREGTVVDLLAWMQLKRAQREFRERTESPDAP